MTIAQINFSMKLNVSLVLYTLYYIILNASVHGDFVVSLTKVLDKFRFAIITNVERFCKNNTCKYYAILFHW